MARSITFGSITGSVRRRGHFDNDDGTDFVDEFISRDILYDFGSSAWAELHEAVVTADPDRILSSGTISLSAGTARYALPSDLFRLRQVDWRPAGSTAEADYERCWPFPDGERDLYRGSEVSAGRPPEYRLQGEAIEVAPIGSTGQLRVVYTPAAAQISSSLQTIDGIEGLEEMMVLLMLRRCKVRADEPTDDVDRELQRQSARVPRSARSRDRGAPRRMVDPRALARNNKKKRGR